MLNLHIFAGLEGEGGKVCRGQSQLKRFTVYLTRKVELISGQADLTIACLLEFSLVGRDHMYLHGG